jgi:hypothetical protein
MDARPQKRSATPVISLCNSLLRSAPPTSGAYKVRIDEMLSLLDAVQED